MFLCIVDKWDLEAVPDSIEHGSVEGGGRWPDESRDTIRAIPEYGYRFARWNDGSTENPRVIFLTQDTSFTAFFAPNDYHAVFLSTDTPERGRLHGGGCYPDSTTVEISATPSHGYVFSHWSDGPTDNPRSITVTSDTSFSAVFVDNVTHTVTLTTDNPDGGQVSGDGQYFHGDTALISATANEGYIFSQWSDGVWYDQRQVTVTQDTAFTAEFMPLEGIATPDGALAFTLSPNPAGDILTVSVSGDGSHHAEIFDIAGRAVLATQFDGRTATLDISALPAGHYRMRVTSRDNAKSAIRPFVKK